MSNWQEHLVESVGRELARQPRWPGNGTTLRRTRIHLAILREPYLTLILNGQKTIESRFSKYYRPPFQVAAPGDVVLLKSAAGPIRGAAIVKRAWFFRRDTTWDDIRNQYGRAMCAQDEEFWEQRAATMYATLLKLEHVVTLSHIRCEKRDRRGWVVVTEPTLW
jgi:hypothetical protein